MSGFHVDPAALEVLAGRFEDAAQDCEAAAAEVESASAGGPRPVSAALGALTATWSAHIRAGRADAAAAAEGLRAAARAYRGTEEAAAADLGRRRG